MSGMPADSRWDPATPVAVCPRKSPRVEEAKRASGIRTPSTGAVNDTDRVAPSARPRKSKIRRIVTWSLLLACALIMLLLSNSHLHSLFIHRAVADLRFEIKPGASSAVRFPRAGPYDQRLGYAYLPSLIHRLQARNFEIASQAVQSPALLRFIEAGGYAVYHEKSQAGLVLKDSSGRTLEATSYPSAVYRRFEEIPAPLIDTLRFIEDRELLDPKDPYRNPALEWRRFTWAAAGQL